MKKGKRKLLIILGVFLLSITIFRFSSVYFLTNNSDIGNIEDEFDYQSEISLGDDNCSTYTAYTCPDGYVRNSSVCYGDGVTGFNVSTCRSEGGTYYRGTCYFSSVNATRDCASCPTGYALSNGNCNNCATGYKKSNNKCVPDGCDAGKGKDNGYCYNCSAGTYSPDNDDTCHKCPAGKYSKSGASECTACSAGEYASGEGNTSCSSCPKGTYSSSTGSASCAKCSGIEYQSKSGQSSCDTCPKGQISSSDRTSCENVPIQSLTVYPTGTRYIASGESIRLQFYPYAPVLDEIEGAELVSSRINYSVPGFSGSKDGASYIVNYTGSDGNSPCVNHEITATASTGNSSASATSNVCVFCSWKSQSGRFRYKNQQPSKSSAQGINQCAGFFTGEQYNGSYYSYTTYWHRCCGDSSPPPSDVGHCYADAKYLGLATKVRWMDSPNREYPYELSGMKNESECTLIPEPTTCSKSPMKSVAVVDEINKCEGEKTIEIANAGQECVGTKFYEITCNQKISALFDYDDDDMDAILKNPSLDVGNISNLNLMAGQGFGFSTLVTTYKECNGKFDSKAWKVSYDNAMRKLSTVPETDEDIDIQRRRNELIKLVEDIKQIVIDYNEYLPEDNDGEELKLSYTYKVGRDVKTPSYTFEKEVINEGKGTFKYDDINNHPSNSDKYNLDLKISGLTNPRNYKWSNQSNKRKVILRPERAYINAQTGDVTTVSENTLDGGKRIYTNRDITPGVYNLKIELGGLGGNGSIIKNIDNCSVTIREETIQYRPVDVSNPFINNEREKGENWYNDFYNYTATINTGTWGVEPRKVINITTDDFAEIRASNRKNSKNNEKNNIANEYLGTCRENDKWQDDFVCSLIK